MKAEIQITVKTSKPLWAAQLRALDTLEGFIQDTLGEVVHSERGESSAAIFVEIADSEGSEAFKRSVQPKIDAAGLAEVTSVRVAEVFR